MSACPLTRSAAVSFLLRVTSLPYDDLAHVFTDQTLALLVSDFEYFKGVRWQDVVTPIGPLDEPPLPVVIGRDADGPILQEDAYA